MACIREFLEEGRFYHIFNHAVGNENLFLKGDNNLCFLRQYKKYVCPFAETYSYCLMPNHFHFLLRLKEVEIIDPAHSIEYKKGKPDFTHPLSNLFNSYAKSYNKINNRVGGLFRQSFKRINVDNEEYLKRLIVYIHTNPVHHGFVERPEDWVYSSNNKILSEQCDFIQFEKVIQLFDDKTNFQLCHRKETKLNKNWTLE